MKKYKLPSFRGGSQNTNDKDVVCCEIKPEESELNVFLHKTVVNEISDPDTDIPDGRGAEV